MEEDYQYCINCGTPLHQESRDDIKSKEEIKTQSIMEVETKPMEVETKPRRKPKYILTSSQRKIFLQKILPVLLIGATIWLISEILFSYVFIGVEFTYSILGIYIFVAVVEVNLFIILYFASKADKIYLGLIIFFSFCFIAGVLPLPIMMFTDFLPQVHMFVTLSLGATFIVCFVGWVLRENYFTKRYLWAHILLSLTGIAILEFIFIIIFNIQNFLLTIPITLSYILIILVTSFFYGARAVQKDEKDPWMLMLFKIEGILLVSLIAAIVTVVIVIIIIILALLCGDAIGDLGGISWGGGTKRKRKKNKN